MEENVFTEIDITEQRRIALKNEKTGIRRLSNAFGLACLGAIAVSYLWFDAIALVLGIFGVSRSQLVSFYGDPAAQCFFQIVFSLLFFMLPFSLYIRWCGFKTQEVLPFKRAKKGTALPLVLIGVGVCAFSNVANNISGSIFEGFGITFSSVGGDYPLGFFGFVLALVSTAVVPAFVEEFGMRGACLGSFKRYGEGFAIIVSSLLFGLIHGNFTQISFAAIIGVVAGYATVKSGSLWPAIIIHFFNNLISVFVYFLAAYTSVQFSNVVYLFVLCINLLLGILGVVMLAKRKETDLEVEENKTVATLKEKLLWFFTSPAVIVCVVLTLLEAVATVQF